jgi:wyosine [tRNA(Phe)-imidazoG37] synthetase (radical SAM superfamily)
MATFLFDSIIFGPVWSRRLGESLGINLLPANRKVCNFNCLYCECGLTPVNNKTIEFPPAEEVRIMLRQKLQEMARQSAYLDSITFAGNGEPTLHPDFPMILDNAVILRNQYFPNATLAVLSNATRIGDPHIGKALQQADLNILKLDSALEDTWIKINCPKGRISLEKILLQMQQFKGKMIIQTLFFRGYYQGARIDNTTETELKAWLEVLKSLRPESVMIYSIARDTAVPGLERIQPDELVRIAGRVGEIGIMAQVTP